MNDGNREYDEYYYKNFASDGEKKIALKEDDISSPYAVAFFNAYNNRFPIDEPQKNEVSSQQDSGVAAELTTTATQQVVAPVAEAASMQTAKKSTVRLAIVIIVAILSVLALVFSALSYFGVFGDYTKILVAASLKDLVAVFAKDFSGYKVIEIFVVCLCPSLVLLALLFAFVNLILSFVAMFSKKRINILWLFALLSLLALVGHAISIYFVANVSFGAILDYLNPLDKQIGLSWGYYILLAINFVAFVLSCCAYKLKRKK